MSFAFDRLPAELRLEIWAYAVQSSARRRLVAEQNLQVSPTLDLVASPLFSVNSESREVVRSFYSVRLGVYRRTSRPSLYSTAAQGNDPYAQDVLHHEDYRGVIYLSPELDNMVSMHPRTELRGPNDMKFFGNYDPELEFDRSERSKAAAWQHRTAPMSEETRQLFHRIPNQWCLLRHASQRLQVQDWVEVREWMMTFGEDEYRKALGFLQSVRINTWEFAHVFGW
ncbi:hypothetical protein F5Y19DRAFT_208087 [Xylariaceae sp. FL1651]|nr:hypothetical protein F5Y19DRAFT_208087 [Xylariaceae sp. FL1651]